LYAYIKQIVFKYLDFYSSEIEDLRIEKPLLNSSFFYANLKLTFILVHCF